MKIPRHVRRDPIIKRQLVAWRMLCIKHRLYRKRLCLNNNQQRERNKRKERIRRAKRWEVEARIIATQNDVLRQVAEMTRHPDLYTTDGSEIIDHAQLTDHRTYSRRDGWRADYAQQSTQKWPNRLTKQIRNQEKREQTAARHTLVNKIRELEWEWMIALHRACYPEDADPPKWQWSKFALLPKKVRDAGRRLPV